MEARLTQLGRPLWTGGEGGVLRGKALAALDADEGLARFVFESAGLNLEVKPQTWTVGDAVLETRVERSGEGLWRAVVAGHEAPVPLASIYAASVSGEIRSLGHSEFQHAGSVERSSKAASFPFPMFALPLFPMRHQRRRGSFGQASRFLFGCAFSAARTRPIRCLSRVRLCVAGRHCRNAPLAPEWKTLSARASSGDRGHTRRAAVVAR